MKSKMMTPEAAALLIQDGDVVAQAGFIGSSLAETINKAVERQFLETGHPCGLTLIFGAGQGSREGHGCEHYSHDKMVRRVIGGHWGKCPKMEKLANENKIQAYNLPQGVIAQMYRDIAIKQGFTLSHVGLDTFVDPRLEGGKLNAVTKEDLVKVVEIEGKELLLYKHVPIDVCIIRGTYADEKGNVTLKHEFAPMDATTLAQACKACGGKVIVQVKQIVSAGSLDPRLVKIPGIYVDALVVGSPEEHEQSIGTYYDPSVSGETHGFIQKQTGTGLDSKKIVARRAALELYDGAVLNLGIGVPEYIAAVAVEENIYNDVTLTIESGVVGGIALGGNQFGAAKNPEALIDHRQQFDFYDGGGIDLAFLGLAEADSFGNVNVSKFGEFVAGCGGFINITQNAKKVFFCGTFTAGGLKTEITGGQLNIVEEGQKLKFVDAVQQITFSAGYALKHGQPVMFITERAVFRLEKDGLHLIEIAPGIEPARDILPFMEFEPVIDSGLREMDPRIFSEQPMGLKTLR